MKKTIGIAMISISLAGCSGVSYVSCPAYASNDDYYETEAIHENLTEEELTSLIDCENCDEID